MSTLARTPSQRAIRALLLTLLGLLGGACGGSGEDAVVMTVRPVMHAQREWKTGASVVVDRLEIPEGLAPWTFHATLMELENRPAEEGGQRSVALGSATAKTLRIPLSADRELFNQVSLKLLLTRHSSVSADLLMGDKVLARTPYSLVIGGRLPQELTLDFPEVRTLGHRADALVLRFAGGARWARCWDIALMRAPWENWAAGANGVKGRPEVDEISREADVLATDNPRTAEFVVPARGVLTLHYAELSGLSVPRKPAQLAVNVWGVGEDEQDGVSAEWTLDKHAARERRWHAAQLDLASLAGQRVQIQFTLGCASPLTDYALLSSPTIYTPGGHTPEGARRTVLFVTSDTHRADHVATASGAVQVQTPTLDALGARGAIFEDCYSSTNITVPSHVALMTAVSPRDTLVLDNMSGVAEEARTIAESFREAGWATLAAASGSQLQDAWSGLGQGFDGMACPKTQTWDGVKTVLVLQGMMADVEDRDLFIWLHLFDAHRPYDVDNQFLSIYWSDDRDAFDATLPDPEFPRGTLNESMRALRDPEFLDAGYKAEVTYVDHVLSKIFDQPRIAGGWIAVTGDHGECLGEYDIWWDHAGLFPENLHVPMLLAGPGVPAGSRVQGPVQHLDIGRTLLDLAGLEATQFPGESMMRHIASEPDPHTPRFALSSLAKKASVEMGGWFCVLYLTPWKTHGMDTPTPRHTVELYDLHPGGDSQRDVARDELERARRMRTLILNWLADVQETGWVERDQASDAERIEQVQALGYTTQSTEAGGDWIDGDCDCEFCELFRER